MIKYQYQILRYIHDQFTGEFGNIGIVLYAPESHFLQCKVVGRYARLSDFFGDLNGQFLLAGIKHFETGINKIGENVDEFIHSRGLGEDVASITSTLLPKDDSALQLTETFYGLDLDPVIALADLFERIIEKYNNEKQAPQHTDYYAWSKFYKGYFDKYGITRQLKKHTVSTNTDTINFDKAWKNGVWNCYQALSFDLKSEDAIKSKVYKWSGIIKALETSQEKLHLYFLTTSPHAHKDLTTFIKDTLTLEEDKLAVEIVEEDKAEVFVAKIRKDMEASKILQSEDEHPF
jgi:hypothetical protein